METLILSILIVINFISLLIFTFKMFDDGG